jgi:2-C-methyl-D-erythritol 4-phosphate cytidylyltransferase
VTVCCILLAAGGGTRFGGAKQFATLGGRSLVEHAVAVAAAACDDVVLVLPEGVGWTGPPVGAVVAGGATRAASVRAGLAAAPATAEVLVVHDAAHPLATVALYRAVIAAVRDGAAAASPAIPVVEAVVRRAGEVAVAAVAKDDLALSQTPHAFRAGVLRELHAGEPEGTDEVTLLLARGRAVALVAGDPTNVHVTTPEELAMAERLTAAPPSRPAGDG